MEKTEKKRKIELERRLRDQQRQEWEEKLEKSKYAKRIKIIIGKDKGIYSKEMIKATKCKLVDSR